jgi:UDP-2-acetamido-3-amino-2,3-dideoxy-glucuronate N-acetyltransferase
MGINRADEEQRLRRASVSVKVATVGMGYWGGNLVRSFHELGALGVICDTDPSRAPAARERYPDVPFVPDYAAVLADRTVTAVALATPAATHHAMARLALEAGKDVFVEKPLALHVDEGEDLVALADKGERILMVGHVLRYHPAVLKLDELIRDGELGRIRYLYSNRLNMGRIRTEENILWSFAPHDVSIMLALLGEEPCEITCRGGAYLNDSIPDVTMSQFVFPSGVRAHIFVNWLHPFKEQRLVVVGSEKMAVFEDTAEDKLLLYPHRVEWKNHVPTAVKAEAERIPLPGSEPLRAECAHFLDCVTSRRQPITDGREGLRILRILHVCQQELEDPAGRRVADRPAAACERKAYFAHETACIDEGCEIGAGTKIWHFSHIMKDARIGESCVFGQNSFVADGVVMGNNVKVQNSVSIYSGTEIEDDVFLGPACVLTNVANPRSQVNRHALYETTRIRRGATIGANATIVCGIEVGRYAFVAAGAVVTADVPDYALMMGVPACRAGWMSRHGHRLLDPDGEGMMTCPESGYRYRETSAGVLRCLDLDEESPLPSERAVGERAYGSFKKAATTDLEGARRDSPTSVEGTRTSCAVGSAVRTTTLP